MKKENLQWHLEFFAEMQIELAEAKQTLEETIAKTRAEQAAYIKELETKLAMQNV